MKQTTDQNILIVDDKPENLLVLEKLLQRPGLNILRAKSGNDALSLILEHEFALALLDVQMPDMDGFETAELMRGNEETKHIPIIFVTAISKDQKHVFKGYETGAVDYLFKPLDPPILQAKVNVFLELHSQSAALKTANENLKLANQKILEQQKSVIEEERLKVLLQMAGATAHELNQPLMALLGHLELMQLTDGNRDKEAQYLSNIKQAGERIAQIVRKIQTIRHDEIIPYAGRASIVNISQKLNILSVEDSDEDYKLIEEAVKYDSQVDLCRARDMEEAVDILRKDSVDLIFLDYFPPRGNGLAVMKMMEKEAFEIPVVVISGKGDETIAAQMIQAGAYDHLPKDSLNQKSISRIIMNIFKRVRLKHKVKGAQNKMAKMSAHDELIRNVGS